MKAPQCKIRKFTETLFQKHQLHKNSTLIKFPLYGTKNAVEKLENEAEKEVDKKQFLHFFHQNMLLFMAVKHDSNRKYATLANDVLRYVAEISWLANMSCRKEVLGRNRRGQT
jgi:hypothetical protein